MKIVKILVFSVLFANSFVTLPSIAQNICEPVVKLTEELLKDKPRVGMLDKYVKTENGDIVGLILRTGEYARLPFPYKNAATKWLDGFNPAEGIEVMVGAPYRQYEKHPYFLPQLETYPAQSITNETPLVARLTNLKTKQNIDVVVKYCYSSKIY